PPALFARYAELVELDDERLRVLERLSLRDLAVADRLDDPGGQGLDLEVELVVLVGGFPLERPSGLSDELPVDDDRGRGNDLHLVVVDDTELGDLEVELAHPREKVLPRLGVDLDPEARVLLGDLSHHFD